MEQYYASQELINLFDDVVAFHIQFVLGSNSRHCTPLPNTCLTYTYSIP